MLCGVKRDEKEILRPLSCARLTSGGETSPFAYPPHLGIDGGAFPRVR